jgi:predicted kinase
VKQNKLEILVGVPGAGKSTYAEQLVKSDHTWVKISRDDIRFSLQGDYESRDEGLVLKVQDAMIKGAIASGKNIVLDNTHCKIATVQEVINTYGKFANVGIKVIGGELSLETIKAQNKARAKAVPDLAIMSMHKAFLNTIKHKAELDQLIKDVAKDAKDIDAPIYVQDKSLPKALIFDIDGTVAKMNNKRGPFEWAKVGNDDPVHEVLELARKLSSSYKIIFMSGRDEACRTETENWLAKH